MSRGHRSTPSPIPRGAARRGRRRRPPLHKWNKTRPPHTGPCRGNQGSFSHPPPHRKGLSAWGGNEQGSHGALCRPCVMSTGPRHARHARGTGGCGTAVAATTRGIPGCWGGGGATVSAGSRGGGGHRAPCPSEGRWAHRNPRPGEGAAVRQGRGQQCCPAGARRSSSAVTGGPPRRAHNPRRTSFRRTATHQGARGGIGKATGRL